MPHFNGLAILHWTYLLLFFSLQTVFPQNPDCDCPDHPGKLTVKSTEKFDVIFLGQPDTLFPCHAQDREALARFRILRLYKGKNIPPILEVIYPCTGACRFEFKKHEAWLLYGHWAGGSGQRVKVMPCERNRLVPKKHKEDEYILYNEMTFEEETVFLRKYLLPAFILPDTSLARRVEAGQVKAIDANRNERFATDIQKLVLLLASLAVFLGLWFWVKRWFNDR